MKKVTFLSRDNNKVVVANDDFRFYSTITRQLDELPNFENLPMRDPQYINKQKVQQEFSSFCYRENEHLVGVTNLGDIFIIEIMDVI